MIREEDIIYTKNLYLARVCVTTGWDGKSHKFYDYAFVTIEEDKYVDAITGKEYLEEGQKQDDLFVDSAICMWELTSADWFWKTSLPWHLQMYKSWLRKKELEEFLTMTHEMLGSVKVSKENDSLLLEQLISQLDLKEMYEVINKMVFDREKKSASRMKIIARIFRKREE